MKRIFEYIALISLLIFSFFLTDKTSIVIKNMDELMIMIKDNKKRYETKDINAVINDKYITPGISKRIVNINKSYNAMKEYGKYNPNLYIYDYIKPSISIINNKGYIINNGNKIKRIVSINFKLDDITYLDDIITILDNNNVSSAFFIDEDFLSNNLDLVYNLINKGYIIGINNNKSNYKWMDTIITKVGKQSNIYCMYSNNKTINKCMSIEGYTIKGDSISNNYFHNIKNNLSSGSIYTLNIYNELVNNLDLILKFIIRKGYKIENIDKHVEE